MFKSDVLCIGSAVLDTFLTIDVPLSTVKLGDKVLVTSFEKHSGGGATNAAVALAKLGLRVKVLTKLGNDHDAYFINQELKDYKIKNLCLHTSHKNTNFSALINSTKENDRIIYAYKGASRDLSLNDFNNSQLNAEWIYLGTLIGKSLQTAKDIVKNSTSKVLFNPSLYLAKKGKKYLKPILIKTEILVLNKEEAEALIGKKLIVKRLLVELSKLGPDIVVITNGPKRLFALNDDKIYSMMPPNVKVVHTAGSGDAFASSFLAGIIKKYSFEDSLKLGMVNACSVIQHVGTKNKLLNEKEAKVMMKKVKVHVS